jgi:intraflagellar transport protein 172
MAESIYMENHSINEAIEMYQSIYKWDEAIDVAEAKVRHYKQITLNNKTKFEKKKNHPDLDKLKKTYYQWLNDTEQYEKAAAVKERERDILGAINLYLRGNMPSKAAKLLMNNRELIHNQEMVSKIATTLIKSDLFENVKIFLFVAL